ncbi:IclR family transcriptional regulator [Geodermatophilus sabuli]|uniref:Transcriptional regulator, IclR family n=1 Tax=Geodermatophilus sabuli TaxID=1564158 RepID=A0A285EMZ5_9ACTN|nr:IclR family transcriptional regulator [Geodermatophilus sabuli]MBB3087023.1 DNA-binding IclR family transcriptional regulator [Geodermatophilus sabuli]SNX99361.1 transcriptional regulator, IclR family [Geodermatophilus sabuli]
MGRVKTGESVLSRAVRIFDAFSPEETALQVSEIARRTDLHVATASRLIAELVSHGLLERGPDREVRVGVRMWELASRASPTLSLRDAAMPYLEDLHAVVGHHAQLGVRDGDDVLFIERLSARDAVVNYSRIAGRLPLHISSSGLVLLAYSPPELQERFLGRPLEPHTADTITTPGRLRATLADVRRQGFVITPGHVHPDAAGVAVPVRNGLQAVVAALSVIVPNDGRAAAQVPALLAAARGVTRSLSAGPPAQAAR